MVEGQIVRVGNRKLMAHQGVTIEALEGPAAALAEGEKTPMYAAMDGRASGIIAVADTVRPTAAATIEWLRQHGVEPVLMNGDSQRTAEAVARQVGIGRLFAEMLPTDKASYIRQLQGREGKRVAMIGDGVNDAPALAQADGGIAIGTGSDVAIEAARVVVMQCGPLDMVRAIFLSRATVRAMKQNLVWASVYNLLAIPVAVGALYRAFGLVMRRDWSALLMSLSSIIVAVNAVLLKHRPRAGPARWWCQVVGRR